MTEPSKSPELPSVAQDTQGSRRPPRVFISYAHESEWHREQVRNLWILLRTNGIDAQIDRTAAGQRHDWALWMEQQVVEADHVLVIASPGYKFRASHNADPDIGRGIQYESRLIREIFYRDQTDRARFIPVVLPSGKIDDVPTFLSPATSTAYYVSEFTVEGAEALLRAIHRRPEEIEPALGPAPDLPSRNHRLEPAASSAPRQMPDVTAPAPSRDVASGHRPLSPQTLRLLVVAASGASVLGAIILGPFSSSSGRPSADPTGETAVFTPSPASNAGGLMSAAASAPKNSTTGTPGTTSDPQTRETFHIRQVRIATRPDRSRIIAISGTIEGLSGPADNSKFKHTRAFVEPTTEAGQEVRSPAVGSIQEVSTRVYMSEALTISRDGSWQTEILVSAVDGGDISVYVGFIYRDIGVNVVLDPPSGGILARGDIVYLLTDKMPIAQ